MAAVTDPASQLPQIEGVLEKRGMLKRWAQVYVKVTNGNVF
eukprot:gene34-7872_t